LLVLEHVACTDLPLHAMRHAINLARECLS